MDSWTGLRKIINDIKRKFEDYDPDDIAAAYLGRLDNPARGRKALLKSKGEVLIFLGASLANSP